MSNDTAWLTLDHDQRQRLVDRFWSRVDRSTPDECWTWTATMNGQGYGCFRVARKNIGAHRLAYLIEVGPIPDGLVIDHLCRNRACVNPVHLEVVTNAENILRGEGAPAKNKRKTHCPEGHPLAGSNVWVHRGQRHCVECRRVEKATRRGYDPSYRYFPFGVCVDCARAKVRCRARTVEEARQILTEQGRLLAGGAAICRACLCLRDPSIRASYGWQKKPKKRVTPWREVSE